MRWEERLNYLHCYSRPEVAAASDKLPDTVFTGYS